MKRKAVNYLGSNFRRVEIEPVMMTVILSKRLKLGRATDFGAFGQLMICGKKKKKNKKIVDDR